METWNRHTTAWLVVLAGLAVAAAFSWASVEQRPLASDAEQIRAVLVKGQRAIEQRKLGDAMALVSREYRDDSGLQFNSLRMLAARSLQQAQSVQISIPSRSVQVVVDPDGKHARAQARVDARVSGSDASTQELSQTVSFRFVKERVRRYLFFSGAEWRIIKTEGWQGAVGE